MRVAISTKKTRRSVLSGVIFGSLVILTLALLFSGFQSDKSVAPAGVAFQRPTDNSDTKTQDYTDTPRLKIPSIDVSSHVEFVGVESNGDMAVPSNYEHVGLYEQGPAPGSTGNAVIAGHVNGNTLNDDGVFARLSELKEGDVLEYYPENTDAPLVFRITQTEEYKLKDFPTVQVFGSSAGKRLNLVTCSGNWNTILNTYSHRLVVYAQLVE